MDAASLATRRARAVEAARDAVPVLAQRGVTALVTGSLARGTFGMHSDLDLIVTDCPRRLQYAIEGLVEDAMDGLRFDLVYAEEIPESKRYGFMNCAVPASDLS